MRRAAVAAINEHWMNGCARLRECVCSCACACVKVCHSAVLPWLQHSSQLTSLQLSKHLLPKTKNSSATIPPLPYIYMCVCVCVPDFLRSIQQLLATKRLIGVVRPPAPKRRNPESEKLSRGFCLPNILTFNIFYCICIACNPQRQQQH